MYFQIYNLLQGRETEAYDRFLAQTPEIGSVPPEDLADLIRTNVMPIAPEGAHQVHLTDGSITLANEEAIMAAFTLFAERDGMKDQSSLQAVGF